MEVKWQSSVSQLIVISQSGSSHTRFATFRIKYYYYYYYYYYNSNNSNNNSNGRNNNNSSNIVIGATGGGQAIQGDGGCGSGSGGIGVASNERCRGGVGCVRWAASGGVRCGGAADVVSGRRRTWRCGGGVGCVGCGGAGAADVVLEQWWTEGCRGGGWCRGDEVAAVFVTGVGRRWS